MFAKAVGWSVRLLTFATIIAFIAASSKIWFPTGLWFHNESSSPIDWTYIPFAVLVQIIEIFVYYTLIRIIWVHGTRVRTLESETAIFIEVIQILGEVSSLIIVEIHFVTAMIQIFGVRVHTGLVYAKYVPTFIYDFYHSIETYLLGDIHFFGETLLVPIATIYMGTLLALTQLLIAYRCSDLLSEIDSASRR
jgi:hypothetical protein